MKTKIKYRSENLGRILVKRNLLIFLIVLSTVSLLLTPASVLKRGIVDNLPWIGYGTLTTEIMFVVGLGIMAYEAGHELGKNPLLWRKNLNHVLHKMVSTTTFWFGFWLNAAGAAGTAVLMVVGVLKILPPQSWFLLLLPLADLSLTAAIRLAAIYAARDLR